MWKQRIWVKALAKATALSVVLWVAGLCLTSACWPALAQKHAIAQSVASPPAGIGDLVTLLFSASSLALFVFSIVMGVAALIGWGSLKEELRKEAEATRNQAAAISKEVVSQADEVNRSMHREAEAVNAATSGRMEQRIAALEDEVRNRLSAAEKEVRGRMYAVLGHALGFLSTKVDEWEPVNRIRLREAVVECQHGYDLLADAEHPVKYMALNNLVYYASVLGEEPRGEFLLREARALRDAGQQHDALHLVMTYCRAAIRFSQDATEIQQAARIAASVAKNEALSEEIRNEGNLYVLRAAVALEALKA